MSNGDRSDRDQGLGLWTILCGALIALFLVFWIGASTGYYDGNQEAAADQHRDHAKATARERCGDVMPSAMFECVYEEIEASERIYYSEQDLRAQQQMALGTLWIMVFTLATAAVAGVGLFWIKKTYDKAVESNVITRDASRAWVSISPDPGAELWINPDKIEFSGPVILQNYGGSPALEVWSGGFITFSAPTPDEVVKRVEGCGPKADAAQTVLFPAEPEGTIVKIDTSESRPDTGTLHVTLFAKYKTVGRDDWRYTAFSYVGQPQDPATLMYGMKGGKLKLNYGDIGHGMKLSLDRVEGGLPIAT